ALAVGPDGFLLVAVDPLDLECLGVVLLHVLHREVGRLEEVQALAQPRALLEAVPEGDVVDAVDRLVGLDRPERRLELDREGLGLEAVLLAERTREIAAGDRPALDQDLPEPAVARLLDQSLLEVGLADEALLHEQRAE